MYDLNPADTRVFLYHSASAAHDPSAAMDNVNAWLGKDRSGSPYANLRVRDVSVTPDGQGGVYTTVVCTLGQLSTGSVQTTARDQIAEASESPLVGSLVSPSARLPTNMTQIRLCMLMSPENSDPNAAYTSFK